MVGGEARRHQPRSRATGTLVHPGFSIRHRHLVARRALVTGTICGWILSRHERASEVVPQRDWFGVRRAALASSEQNAIVSRLSLVEMESVLAIKVRIGELDADRRELARRRLRADLAQGRLKLGPPIVERHYQNARVLLARYGVERGLRTLDALQLAVALELHEAGVVSVLVAADQRLCRVAEDCDFPTVDPADPDVILPLRIEE
jgi:predicted nucleic acid-binding protein